MDSGISSETSIEILRSVHSINSGPTTTHHGVVAFHPPASQPKTHPHMLNVERLDQKKNQNLLGRAFQKSVGYGFSQPFWDEIIGWYYCIPILSKMSDLFLGVKKVTTMQPPGAVSAR